MELRGQDEEILMPSNSSYNLSHKVSSTKLSSSTVASTVGERRDQTVHGNTILSPTHALDHHQLYHPQQSNPHPVENTDKPRTDPEPNPDPVPISIAGSGATNTPITGISTVKAPRPHPQTIASTPRAAPKVRYRECLKNHAASMGGHVMDGCGEFMSSGEEGTPEALKCAACDCHRNFHRKEIERGSPYVSNYHYANPSTNNVHGEVIPPHLHHQHHKFPHVLSTTPPAGNIAPIMVSFGRGGGARAESSSEDLNMFRPNVGVQTSAQAQQSRKRFRTRFTGEQKDKMMEFAENLGWKIHKHDEQEVQQFCSEVGVTKQVFKVWMHNNKQAMKKKQM